MPATAWAAGARLAPARAWAERALTPRASSRSTPSRVSPRGVPLSRTRSRRRPRNALDERDRALLHELVLGTLRRRGWLDHVLAGLSSRPIDRLTTGRARRPAPRCVPAPVPARAPARRGVRVGRAGPQGRASLGGVRERRPAPPAPRRSAPGARSGRRPDGWLTSAGSLPRWLAERWRDRLGPGPAIARARVLLDPPPTHVRLNPRVADAMAQLAAAGVSSPPHRGAGRARGGRGPPRPLRRARRPLRAGRGLAARRAAWPPRRASSSTPAPRREARRC